MALPISVTYTFATATSAIPLSQLDANFTTVVNGINGIGNGTNSLSNVSITGGNVAVTTANATTINATTLNAATLRSDTSLTFQSNGTTTAMTVDTSQNVGIGTSSPGAKLQVNGIVQSGATGTNGNVQFLRSSDGAAAGSISWDSTNTALAMNNGVGSGVLTFLTNSSERMRIDSSGNVGIGTSSPSSYGKLAVSSGSGVGGYFLSTGNNIVLDGNPNNTAIMSFFNGGAYFGSIGVTGNSAMANDTSSDIGIIAQINRSIRFYTNGASERMRIDSSGNLLVGVTADPAGSGNNGVSFYKAANNFEFHSRSGVTTTSYVGVFYNGNGTVGSISTNGSATAYTTSSDYRLKNSVAPMTTGLATVSALKPVTYKWNADDSDGEGFIAHELQSVIPHAVIGEKDAVNEDGSIKPQGVDYSKIVVHLVAACQELSAKVAALEGK